MLWSICDYESMNLKKLCISGAKIFRILPNQPHLTINIKLTCRSILEKDLSKLIICYWIPLRIVKMS